MSNKKDSNQSNDGALLVAGQSFHTTETMITSHTIIRHILVGYAIGRDERDVDHTLYIEQFLELLNRLATINKETPSFNDEMQVVTEYQAFLEPFDLPLNDQRLNDAAEAYGIAEIDRLAWKSECKGKQHLIEELQKAILGKEELEASDLLDVPASVRLASELRAKSNSN